MAEQVASSVRQAEELGLDWPIVPLSDVAACRGGYGFPPDEQGRRQGDVPFFKVSDMNLPRNSQAMNVANNYVDAAAVSRLRERIGLYPNTAKTRLVARGDFADELMKEENDYLGELEEDLSENRPVELREFRMRLRRHLALQERPRAWERVLRRYYKVSRQLREPLLLAHMASHIAAYPGSTRGILDYASTFRLTAGRIRAISAVASAVAGMYEDVILLGLQYLAVSPAQRSESTRVAASNWARDVVERFHRKSPRIAAAGVIVLGKFGGNREFCYLDDLSHLRIPRNGDVLRLQLLTVMLGIGLVDSGYIPTVGVESPEARQVAEFLMAIEGREPRAVGLALGALEPRERRGPLMFMIPPRAMFLTRVVESAEHARLDRVREHWRRMLVRSE